MTWVDGVLLMVALLYAWQAYERGVVAVWVELVSWLLAWWVGAWVKEWLAVNLVLHLGLKGLVYRQWSYLLTVIGVQLVSYRALTALARRWPRHYFGLFWQVVLGLGPALVNGVFFALVILMVLIALPFRYPIKDEILASFTAEQILVNFD